MNAIANVDFHGHTLVTTEHNHKPYVAMRPIVDAIGLQWQAQFNRIKRHPVLSTCVSMMDTQLPGDTQRRKVTFLPLSMLNGWLFGVDANRVKPEIRSALIMYQRECFDVLAAYWGKSKAKPALPSTLTPAQQRHIQKLVASLADLPGNSFAQVYRSIKDRFNVGSYKDIPASQYPALCNYLGGKPQDKPLDAFQLESMPLEGDLLEGGLPGLGHELVANYPVTGGIWLYTKAGYSDEYIMALAGHATEAMKARYYEGHERAAPVTVDAGLLLSGVDLTDVNWETDLSPSLMKLADAGE